jgi:hypothetical protein
MTAARLPDAKSVLSDACARKMSPPPWSSSVAEDDPDFGVEERGFVERGFDDGGGEGVNDDDDERVSPPRLHHIGPAQFPTNSSAPTARTL